MAQVKEKIAHSKEMDEVEKAKIMEEAKRKSSGKLLTFFYHFLFLIQNSELKRQKRAQQKMEAELVKMQEKLLIGGVTIQDRTTQQERELEVKRSKLAEERLKERFLKIFCQNLQL